MEGKIRVTDEYGVTIKMIDKTKQKKDKESLISLILLFLFIIAIAIVYTTIIATFIYHAVAFLQKLE